MIPRLGSQIPTAVKRMVRMKLVQRRPVRHFPKTAVQHSSAIWTTPLLPTNCARYSARCVSYLLQGVWVTARCVSYCSYQLHFCEQPDVTLTDLWFQLASSSCGWPSYLIDVRMWQVLFNQPGCCCTFFTAAALGSFLTILQAGSDCSREPLEIILVGLSAGHVPPLLI